MRFHARLAGRGVLVQIQNPFGAQITLPAFEGGLLQQDALLGQRHAQGSILKIQAAGQVADSQRIALNTTG